MSDPIYPDANDNILLRRIAGFFKSITTSGGLAVNTTLSGGDIQLGAVEIKDASSDNRASVSSNGQITVCGTTPRLAASFTRGGDATQYNIGDLVSNSTTAANVVPLTFSVGRSSGRLTGARIVVEAASGTIVLPAFDLILFRPETNIPFTAGSYPADNAVLTLSAEAMRQIVGIISFSASAWQNPTGGTTASGNAVYQAASLATRSLAPFNVTSTETTNLLGLIRAQNTWNPGNVAQTINVMLDSDLDA